MIIAYRTTEGIYERKRTARQALRKCNMRRKFRLQLRRRRVYAAYKRRGEIGFSKICCECEKLGYTIFQRNDLEENRHASYNGDMLIHIYFCPSEKACASYATRSRLGSSARSRNTREDAAALCGSLKTTTHILTAGCAISCAARTTAFLL